MVKIMDPIIGSIMVTLNDPNMNMATQSLWECHNGLSLFLFFFFFESVLFLNKVAT